MGGIRGSTIIHVKLFKDFMNVCLLEDWVEIVKKRPLSRRVGWLEAEPL